MKLWLTEEQVELFQSDFRVVADFFVQMRKNGNYVPTKQQIVHVQEVLHTMSVLTQDNRFERVYQSNEEEEVPKNMCEVLDLIENRGIAKGIEKGEKKWRISLVCKKLRKGKSVEVIADEMEEIRSICAAAEAFAPDYDEESVFNKLMERQG